MQIRRNSIIRPGDRVFFDPGENHWHGAAPGRLMVHMDAANDERQPVTGASTRRRTGTKVGRDEDQRRQQREIFVTTKLAAR